MSFQTCMTFILLWKYDIIPIFIIPIWLSVLAKQKNTHFKSQNKVQKKKKIQTKQKIIQVWENISYIRVNDDIIFGWNIPLNTAE